MREIRYAAVNGKEIPVLISDENEALLAARAAGGAIVGLWSGEGRGTAAPYAVEALSDVTEEFLERAARRHLGLPWRICETRRLLVREMTGDDFDEVWANQVGRGFGSVEELEAYTKHQYTFYEFGFWALVEKETGDLIGVAGLKVPEEDGKEEQELEILGEILEAYVDTPIKKDAFLIGDLGLDSFLIVYFISEVDDRFGAAIEMPEHVEYMTVQDVLDQLNGRK